MDDKSIAYVGPVAPIWPLHRPAARVGCSALVWALLAVGLGLVVFSMGLGAAIQAFLNRHAGILWVGVGLGSLVWPALYVLKGWFRTLYGYWTRDDAEGLGVACETCGSQVRRGRTHDGHFVCDVCARRRVCDNRRLVAPGVVMVGLAFLANGISSLLEHRARQLAEQADGRWLGALTVPERSLLETIDVLGVVGSIGLAIAGTFILARITRYVFLAPIGPRSMETARRQITLALDREASERREPQPLAEQ